MALRTLLEEYLGRLQALYARRAADDLRRHAKAELLAALRRDAAFAALGYEAWHEALRQLLSGDGDAQEAQPATAAARGNSR